jgi:hypothetical protein
LFFGFGGEVLSISFGRTVNQYLLDAANFTHRLRMSPRLPAGSKHAENRGVGASEKTRSKSAARRNSNALNNAVRKNRQRLSGLRRK